MELASSLYLRTVDAVPGPANAGEQRLEAEFGSMLLSADRSRQTLDRIGAVLGRKSVRAMALKGTAHTLELYTGPLPRHLSDLDLLVRAQDLWSVTAALSEQGYEPEPWNGPEDVLLQAEEGPGLRLLAPGRLPIDLQTRLPGLRPDSPALEEAWAAARPCAGLDGLSAVSDRSEVATPAGLLRLHPLHELLVAVAHFCVHLKPPLTVSPKWMTDMLLMIHRNTTGRHPRIGPPVEGDTFEEKIAKINLEELVWPFAEPVSGSPEPGWEVEWTWSEFWETARRWGIVPQCQIVGATLNAHWHAGVPDVPSDCQPIPIGRLFQSGPDHAVHSFAALPSAYLARIARARALPNTRARIRYLFSLAFPSAASLRHRYGLPDNASVAFYRLAHPVRTLWKILRGIGSALWIAPRR